MDYTNRGGGVGGGSERSCAASGLPGKITKGGGGSSNAEALINQKSSLVSTVREACLLSEALPSRTALHRAQGCLPSKVLTIADPSVEVWEKSIIMFTQATDCRMAH